MRHTRCLLQIIPNLLLVLVYSTSLSLSLWRTKQERFEESVPRSQAGESFSNHRIELLQPHMRSDPPVARSFLLLEMSILPSQTTRVFYWGQCIFHQAANRRTKLHQCRRTKLHLGRALVSSKTCMKIDPIIPESVLSRYIVELCC